MKNCTVAALILLGCFSFWACQSGGGETISPENSSSPRVPVTTTPTITPPFFGSFATAPSDTKYYDSPGSSAHKAWPLYDDTNAYDLNLLMDKEQNLPAVSPISGTVIKVGNDFPGTLDGGQFGGVFIYKGKSSDVPSTSIAVGMMHLRNILVKENTVVSAGQQIGEISNKYPGSLPIHLHFSYYEKKEKGIWTSVRVNFSDRPFTLALKWINTNGLKVNGTNQITGDVPFGRKGVINSETYVKNTFWSSDNLKIATVDGTGKVTGKMKGSTTIRVKFSGQEFSIPVTVQ